jgi:hypothetical protein
MTSSFNHQSKYNRNNDWVFYIIWFMWVVLLRQQNNIYFRVSLPMKNVFHISWNILMVFMRRNLSCKNRDEKRFPIPLSIVFGNVYEFTDATGDTTDCPLASLVGLDIDIGVPILRKYYYFYVQ